MSNISIEIPLAHGARAHHGNTEHNQHHENADTYFTTARYLFEAKNLQEAGRLLQLASEELKAADHEVEDYHGYGELEKKLRASGFRKTE